MSDIVLLERQRSRAVIAFWRTLLVLVGTLPLAALPFVLLPRMSGEVSSQAALVVFSAPIAWLVGAVWAWRRFVLAPSSLYRWEYKRSVFTELCRAHFPGIAYQPDGGMPWRLLDDSGLFSFASDVYRSEDRFEGRWGATDVCFSEAVAERARTRGWGKNRETVYETYFRGLIFSADFHKSFHSTTRLVPKEAECARVRGEERAHLEDPAFETAFDTWTTDQVDVRYVLSPGMLERFVALNRRFPGLRVRLHAERLLLLLPSVRNRFEPSLDKRADDRDQLESFIADVRACLAVVDDLNLNTRIWSKS
jgi:hypothetical protein